MVVTTDLLDDLREQFCDGFPVQLRGSCRNIAEEIEHPLVDDECRAANWQDAFAELAVCSSVERVSKYRLRLLTGDEVMPEAGWATMELATKPYDSLDELDRAVADAMGSLARLVKAYGIRVLGYGVQPITHFGEVPWVDDPRYDALRQSIGDCIDPMTIVASQQEQIEVTCDEAIPVVNMLGALSGPLTAMLCHAPINSMGLRAKASRELTWDKFQQSRVGIPPSPFVSLADYFDRMASLKMAYYEERGACHIGTKSLAEHLSNGAVPEDIAQLWRGHESTVWPVVRLRWRERGCCTIEYRAACTQEPGDRTVAALVLGLVENLGGAEELVASRPWDTWKGIRQRAIYDGLSFLVGMNDMSMAELAGQVVAVAEVGLLSRGLGEERFLEVVKRRLSVNRPYAPADEAMADFKQGGVEQLVDRRVYK